jgi:threonine aldolase
MIRFLSDNTASVSPEILQALQGVNHGLEHAYGEDPWSQRLDRVFGEYFDAEVRTFAVATGTAANSLALATITRRRMCCETSAARPSSFPAAHASSP